MQHQELVHYQGSATVAMPVYTNVGQFYVENDLALCLEYTFPLCSILFLYVSCHDKVLILQIAAEFVLAGCNIRSTIDLNR